MTLRKILFWMHLTAGIVAGVVILIMSVTGVLLTYERQIVAWADRGYRSAPPSPGAPRLSVETLVAKVREQRPGMPATITLRSDPSAAAQFGFGREGTLFVNPYTGEVLGEGSRSVRAVFDKLTDWHRRLGDDARRAGPALTGACNLLFLFIVASGPFLWWPRSWTWQHLKNIVLFRRGLRGRARDFNWHNVVGIWSAVPLFFIVLGGVIMSYAWANDLLYRLTGSEPPARQAPPVEASGRARGPSPNIDGLDSLWDRAELQVADWQSISLRLPPSPVAPVTFAIDQGNGGQPQKRAQLTLDRQTAEVVRWEPFSSNSLGRRLRSWARFLHTGEAAGWIGQTIAGLATAGAVALSCTGIPLAWRRFQTWRRAKKDAKEPVLAQR